METLMGETFWIELGFTILNIIVLFLVLKKILFKPVTKFMDNRADKIQEALNMAEDSKKMVEQLKVEYDAKLKTAKEDGKKVVEEYKQMAQNEYNTIIENAKKDADRIIAEAKQELETERKQLITTIRAEVSDLVLSASEKVIKKNLDNESNRKLISDFINKDDVA